MKHSIKSIAGIISCLAFLGCTHPATNVVVNKITLPQDVLASCTVTQTTFNSWFVSGTAQPNGAVLPANSVAFKHQNNCEFYQWSENMFLWITSPNKTYGSGNTVLESPVFYDVLPVDSNGKRKLQRHEGNTPLHMASHITKNGPNHLPVIIDTKGRMLEVEIADPQAKNKALVKSGTGLTEVDHVSLDNKGAFVFLDRSGKVIQHPQAIIRHKLNAKNIVQKFTAGNKSVFLDAAGNQVQTEAGQATGDVLMAQNGSLVYYLTMVNDVYAWFVTGAMNGKLTANEFPTTQGALDSIITYAKANHATLPDSNALAMELKTSWVEASKLSNPDDYITVTAVIPTYDTTDAKKWVPKGEKTTKMALVGMHVVGSVAGHPEMIWATFEHQSNTPNAEYRYLDVNNKVKTVQQDTGKGWLFNSNASDTSVNISHMTNVDAQFKSSDTIRAQQGFTITPSNTLTIMPWGSAKDSVTNQEDKSSAASNSEIISINNNIRKMLGADVRGNYLLIGATWTSGGAAPNGGVYGLNGTAPGVSIGTSVLANSTMETYFQLPKFSCFTCHSSSVPSLNPDSISHIYGKLQPLITLHEVMDKKKGK
ncbi:hypothetical protein [Mucilaginibacter xinganensis]|uniref:Cytochrome c family protein n=1 Tax=Mucilaginibacter xinganensis TaxID=1234841 RepID=A0A223NUP4_9SPHI|nr:hypothetical protein [Mucilaginibacter xinganensis]ASU33593.1 hypothetical protein MuYL_1697 [Mucilaginibacter xinganensis]